MIEPSDPSSVIINDYRMENAQEYVKRLNSEQKDVHVTLTHVMA